MNEEGEMVEDFPTMGKEAWKVFWTLLMMVIFMFSDVYFDFAGDDFVI